MKKAKIDTTCIPHALVLLFTILIFSSCDDSSIKRVTIGEQTWMAENLNVDKFNNGDPIPHAETYEEWEAAWLNREPAWCYYENDTSLGKIFGKLYNWYAVNDSRGLAPRGWRIPTHEDMEGLAEYLGGSKVAGGKLKSEKGWAENGNGNNSTGFNAMPAGNRFTNGGFFFAGQFSYFWTSTSLNNEVAMHHVLLSVNESMGNHGSEKGHGMSVRCIKD